MLICSPRALWNCSTDKSLDSSYERLRHLLKIHPLEVSFTLRYNFPDSMPVSQFFLKWVFFWYKCFGNTFAINNTTLGYFDVDMHDGYCGHCGLIFLYYMSYWRLKPSCANHLTVCKFFDTTQSSDSFSIRLAYWYFQFQSKTVIWILSEKKLWKLIINFAQLTKCHRWHELN